VPEIIGGILGNQSAKEILARESPINYKKKEDTPLLFSK
jgi:hypothetical protein